MKKFLLFFVNLLCVLSFGLYSCGGGGSSDSDPPFSSDTGASSDIDSSDTGGSSSSSSEDTGTWTDDYPVTPVPGK